jgi:hypothetical protein
MDSVKALAISDATPSSGKKSKTHPPKPYDIIQGMEVSSTRWRKPSRSAKELSAQCKMCRTARPSHSVCGLPPTCTLDRRPTKTIQIKSGR